jgi:glycerophosphoryl diester phosphodiesterase
MLKMLFVFFVLMSSFTSVFAMRSGPFWEKDAAVDKDKWSIYDLKGKKRKDKARTALMDAVVNNQKEIVILLLENGSDVNAKEKSGWTALHWAVHYNRNDIAKLLIEKGADINAETTDGYGQTPLSLALKENMTDIAKILIKRGAGIKPETDEVKSMLSIAIKNKQAGLAELMINENVFIMGCPRSKVFPVVIAQRGSSATCPENTLPAFEKALKDGAIVIGVDVQLSKDKELVVINNLTLERTTNGEGNVADYNLEELKKLDAGSWFKPSFENTKIPTLEEVFKLVGNKAIINIELKGDNLATNDFSLETAVLELIKQHNRINGTIVSSFNYQMLRNIRNRSKKINLAVLSDQREVNLNIVDLVRAIGAVAYCPESSVVDKKLVKKLHDAGILVMPWAYDNDNNEELMKKMKSLKVDGFFAKDPHLLKTVFFGSNIK